MEPITVNLPDIGQWGPYGYLAGYVLSTVFLGALAQRYIRLSGVTSSRETQAAYIFSGTLFGIVGAVAFIATLCSANDMFDRSIRLTDQNIVATYQMEGMEELNSVVEKMVLQRLLDHECSAE